MKASFKKTTSGLRSRWARSPLAVKSLLVAGSLAAVTGVAYAAETWDNNGTIWFSKYILVNSQWGRKDLSSSQYWQKIWHSNDQWFGWEWSSPESGDDRVKGYPNVTSGRIWGSTKSNNSGLPVQVSWNKNIYSSFGATVSNTTGKWNLCYDIWFHDNNRSDPGDYKAEMMIWTARSGGAKAWGNWKANVNLEGANWDVYHIYAWNNNGDNKGWDVYSFQKTGGNLTDKQNLNIKSFTNYLRDSIPNAPKLNSNWWLHSIGFGSEPQLGRGKVDMWRWKCDVS